MKKKSNLEFNDFKYQMTKNECVKINDSLDMIESFYSYWTEKKIDNKADGNGMQFPSNSFEFNRICY